MAKQLQLRRGTTAQHATFTGAVGEVTIDTDKDVVVVHDGATAGGFPSQKQLVSGTNIKTINNTSLLGSGDISIIQTISVANIDEMKDFVAPYDNYALNVLGYSEAGDGGGGIFYYDANSTETDNGGTIIEPTSGSGRWIRVYDFVKLEYFGIVSPDYVLDSNWIWDSTIDKSTANLGTIIDPSVGIDEQGTGSGFGCMVRQYEGAVNVKWFGAKGDGVTDDTVAIQNAINYCITQKIVDGIYGTNNYASATGPTSGLTKYSPTFLEGGCGIYGVSSDILITNTLGFTLMDIHLKSLSVYDNVIKIGSFAESSANTLSVQNLTLSNITIEGQHLANNGIYIEDGLAVKILNCVIVNTEVNGIYVGQESHDVLIHANNIGYNRAWQSVSPLDGTPESTTYNGIYLQANDNIVTSNVIHSAGTGIYIDSLSAGNEFSSNHIYGISTSAMTIAGPRNRVTGNFLDSRYGILLLGYGSTDCIISNNTFLCNSATGYGITFKPTVDMTLAGTNIVQNIFNNFQSTLTDFQGIKFDESLGTVLGITGVLVADNNTRNVPLSVTEIKRSFTFTSTSLASMDFPDFGVFTRFTPNHVHYTVQQTTPAYTNKTTIGNTIAAIQLSQYGARRMVVSFDSAVSCTIYVTISIR